MGAMPLASHLLTASSKVSNLTVRPLMSLRSKVSLSFSCSRANTMPGSTSCFQRPQ